MVDEKWSARFWSYDQIRSRGAIGNLNDGIEINTQGRAHPADRMARQRFPD